MNAEDRSTAATDYSELDFFSDWRQVVSLVDAIIFHVSPTEAVDLRHEVAGLVAMAEARMGRARITHRLVRLRLDLGLTLTQQRMVATALATTPEGRSGIYLCRLATLVPTSGWDGDRGRAELVELAERQLIRPVRAQRRLGPSVARYTAGEATGGLIELVRSHPPHSGQAVLKGAPERPVRTDDSIVFLDDLDMGSLVVEISPAPEASSAVADKLGWDPARGLRPALRELEMWSQVYKLRQTYHRWIKFLNDPFKAYPGNVANDVSPATAARLDDEARTLEEQLVSKSTGRVPVNEQVAAILSLDGPVARVALYLYVAEALDVGLAMDGRSILSAAQLPAPAAGDSSNPVAGTGTEPVLALLEPCSPLLADDIVTCTRPGRTAFTSEYQLSRSALQKLTGIKALPRAYHRSVEGEAFGLGFLRDPRVRLDDVVLPARTRERIEDALALLDPRVRKRISGDELSPIFWRARGASLLFEGLPGTGKSMVAEAYASRLGKKLYVVRAEQLTGSYIGDFEKHVVRVFQEAADTDAVLLLDEADALLAARTPARHAVDKICNQAVAVFLGCLEEYDVTVVLTTNLAVTIDPALERRLTAHIHFDLPGPDEREALWRRHLPSSLHVEGELDIPWLARRYVLTGARIRNAVAATIRRSLRRLVGIDQPPAANPEAQGDSQGQALDIPATDLLEAAKDEVREMVRDRSRADVGSEATEIGELRIPTVDLAAVVLPEDVRLRLKEVLVAADPAARELLEGVAFLETFRTGRGTILLFEGAPGTGKTMTAEAVAGELGKPLLVVGPDRVLSKWHGESERMVQRVFDEMEAHDAVLVLDEADGILSARVDAMTWGGKTGNNMVNILLLRLETTAGIVILTTNRSAVLDPALDRRLTARLTFLDPDEGQRLEILKRHLPKTVAVAPEADLKEIVSRFAVSGGLIRNAALSAVRRMLAEDPRARTLAKRHLERAFEEAARAGKKRRIGFDAAGLKQS